MSLFFEGVLLINPSYTQRLLGSIPLDPTKYPHISWFFVRKATMNHPYVEGLYHPMMVKLGMIHCQSPLVQGVAIESEISRLGVATVVSFTDPKGGQ